MHQQVLQALPTSNTLSVGAQDQLWHRVAVTLGLAAGKELWEKELGEASLEPPLETGAAFGFRLDS